MAIYDESLQPQIEGGRERDLAIFDVRPTNVVKTPEGVIASIDAIPIRLDSAGQRILSEAGIQTVCIT